MLQALDSCARSGGRDAPADGSSCCSRLVGGVRCGIRDAGRVSASVRRRDGVGGNGGWQREIAVWNLGTLVTTIGLTGSGAEVDRAQARGFAVLSTLFGINHLVAAVQCPRSISNGSGALVNAAGVAVGAIGLCCDRSGAAG